MSSKKNKKIHQGFRIDEGTLSALKSLPEKDPILFRTYNEIVNAFLHYCLNLPRSEQKEILSKYLTKDL